MLIRSVKEETIVTCSVGPMPERLNTFVILPRTSNTSSNEMLSLLKPMEITGSIGKF